MGCEVTTPEGVSLEARKAAVRLLESQARLVESVTADLTGAWWLDPRDYGIGDTPGFLPPGGPNALALLNRQKRGEFIPAFLDENQLSWYRRRIRHLVVNNEIAINAVQQRINYAIGTGFRYEVAAKRDDCPAWVVEDAQAVVDAFTESNELALREAEALARIDTDGEAIIRLFPQEGGLLATRFVEPEFLRSPNGDGGQDSFGVRHKGRDVESVEGYWIDEGEAGEGAQLTFVPACEVLHIKHPETPSTSKRGLTAFFPIETTLRAVEDLVTSTVSLAKARAKIAWVRQLSGTTSSIAQALVNNQAAAVATNPATGQQLNMEHYPYGAIMTVNEGQKIEMPSANIAASEHVAIVQMVMRIVAARFSMPEYLLSSDASNGNYASTMVAESPFVKSMQRLQDYLGRLLGRNRYKGHRQSLIWRQLSHAAENGLLPSDIDRWVDVQVEGPALTVRDTAKEAQVDLIYNKMRVKSRKTVQLEQGLDPDTEEANLALEESQHPAPSDQTDQPASNTASNTASLSPRIRV